MHKERVNPLSGMLALGAIFRAHVQLEVVAKTCSWIENAVPKCGDVDL